MSQHELSLWVRINGNSHAFGRELGCECDRCRTVNWRIAAPPGGLAEFAGWDDPPVRANTSASLIIGDAEGAAVGHVLVDAGGGVIDGLTASGIHGIEHVSAVLVTHWHLDHVGGLSQLGENLRRTAARRGSEFIKAPLYCTLAAYEGLRDRAGLAYILERCFRFQEIVPEAPFSIAAGPATVRITPLPVVHGSTEGAVIYVAEALGRKVLFAWDIESPEAAFPDGQTNLQIFERHTSLLKGADLHIQECNTWSFSGRGHSTYHSARAYFEIVQARRTLLTHLSGHEDGPGNPGFGWTDARWQAAVENEGVEIAKQGMVLRIR
jgi:glyoxylase-like metal-dependent hydrolase (beta-lactamase superfamily II)